MNKSELIKAVAERSGVSLAEAGAAVDAALDAITSELAENKRVKLSGFGEFKVGQRASRVGRNPSTGEKLNIPARRVPSFKAAKSLKDAVGGSDSDEAPKASRVGDTTIDP